MASNAEFSDNLGRHYTILDSGEIFENYVLRDALSLFKVQRARNVIQDTTRNIPHGENLGPLLLSVSLPRGNSQISFPNHASDNGHLVLTHRQTTRTFAIAYTHFTKKSLRSRTGLIYASQFTV